MKLRFAKPVIPMKHPQTRYQKPDEAKRAKNPERYDDGQRAIVIVANHFCPFQRVSQLLLFRGTKAVSFAYEKVMGDFGQGVPPYLQPPPGRGFRIEAHHGIDLDKRHNRERTLNRKRQLSRKKGHEPPDPEKRKK